MSRSEITRRASMGELTRVARGWYALPFANDQVMRAIRLGGRLGCLSGCDFYGLWVPAHGESSHRVWQRQTTLVEAWRPTTSGGEAVAGDRDMAA